MTTDTKLRLHNISSKAALFYGSKIWQNAQNVKAAQMRFLRLLLGLTILDCQNNTNF
jgi:hypothetical protein